jgi:RNA polymerase sigma-70 factor, ECF subfamily
VSTADDPAIIAAAQRGDRASLDTLLRAHHDKIYALCRRMTGNEADARDATQEAMLAICRGLPRFDGRSALSTWIYRVTANACLDELRRRARRPALVEEAASLDASASGAAAHTVSFPDQVAHGVDLDAALRTLAPEFRAAVVLRDLCDLDYAEIGEVLGIPPGTVRSRIARGRAALALILGNPSNADQRPTTRP